jgi:hypothetical protein
MDKSRSVGRIFAPRFAQATIQNQISNPCPLHGPIQGLNEAKSEQRFAFQPNIRLPFRLLPAFRLQLCSRSFDINSVRTYHWMGCSPPHLYCQNTFHICVICPCGSVPVSHVLSSKFVQEPVVEKPPPLLGEQGSRRRSSRSQYRYRYYQRLHCHYRVPIQP